MEAPLIVCYSLTGTSRQLARLLATQQGWPLGEVVDDRPRAGLAGMLRCLLDSLLRRCPPVHYRGPDPTWHDPLVLVGPIWAGRLCGPLRSFLVARRAELRDVALLSTQGSHGAEHAQAEVARILGHAPVLAAAFVARSVQDGSCAASLRSFGDQLARRQHADPVRPDGLSPHAA